LLRISAHVQSNHQANNTKNVSMQNTSTLFILQYFWLCWDIVVQVDEPKLLVLKCVCRAIAPLKLLQEVPIKNDWISKFVLPCRIGNLGQRYVS
jgi:hypothetical protein